MGIEFESEQEQIQTNALAGRMIDDATAQGAMVNPSVHVQRVQWTSMDSETGECDDLYLELSNGVTVSAPRATIAGAPTALRNAAHEENARQAGPLVPDALRGIHERIEGPELDEQGDPV